MNAPLPALGRLQLEQLVYGSFVDRPNGYHIRFRTSGIGDVLASTVVQRCDNWGEIRDPRFASSLMVLDLPAHETDGAGPLIMVDQITNLGVDASGRRGAQMHHVVILTPPEFEALASDPFLIAELVPLRSNWAPEEFHGPVEITLGPWGKRLAETLAAGQQRLAAALGVAVSILNGKKCLVFTEAKDEELCQIMRLAWILLPPDRRIGCRASTFAFLNRNDFHLAAIYTDLASAECDEVLSRLSDLSIIEVASNADLAYLQRVAEALDASEYERALELTYGPKEETRS